MSVSLLKLIASLGMLIDHIGSVFGWQGWELISPNTTEVLRSTANHWTLCIPCFCIFNCEWLALYQK